jgi:hypothetical protein
MLLGVQLTLLGFAGAAATAATVLASALIFAGTVAVVAGFVHGRSP